MPHSLTLQAQCELFQGRRSAGMKASYETLQQLAQATDVSSLNSSLSLPSGDVRDSASNATALPSTTQTTKKQKKCVSYFVFL